MRYPRKPSLVLPPLIFCLLIASACNSWAQVEQTELDNIQSYTLNVERDLRKAEPDEKAITEEISTLTRYRSIITRCVQTTRVELDSKTDKIQSIEENLGELDPDLKDDTQRALQQSKIDQAEATKRLVDCQLLEQRVGELISSLTDIKNRRLISKMQFQEDDGLETTLEILKHPRETLSHVYELMTGVLERLSGLGKEVSRIIPMFFTGLVMAFWVRSRLKTRIANFDTSVRKISFSEASIRVLHRFALWVFPLLFASMLFFVKEFDESHYSNFAQLIFISTGYFLTLALISFLLAPREGYARILTLRHQIAVPMARSLRALVTLSTVGGIFYLFLRNQDIAPEVIAAARLIALTIFSVNALIFLMMLAKARVITPFSRLVCYFI
ncbi:MAG: hypothetical protein ACU84Q_12720 [Gammaproteobacteria bacterium]